MKTTNDPDAAVAICHALGINPLLTSEIEITITAPGRFRIQTTNWVDEPNAPGLARAFATIAPQAGEADQLGGA